jgi:hypothetical protein
MISVRPLPNPVRFRDAAAVASEVPPGRLFEGRASPSFLALLKAILSRSDAGHATTKRAALGSAALR